MVISCYRTLDLLNSSDKSYLVLKKYFIKLVEHEFIEGRVENVTQIKRVN